MATDNITLADPYWTSRAESLRDATRSANMPMTMAVANARLVLGQAPAAAS